ncbi:MAG: sodium/solute symporter [Pirellulales bacterium]|nr:sodium/solute symporter [Pirellulales bacterium]
MDQTSFTLEAWDYIAFGAFFVGVSLVGYWAGRKERSGAEQYFLAGKSLPWYVVGGSFIGSNISSEHFIGMVGAAVVFGICVAMSEWMNVATFTLLIWFFIPFLLASQVFTTPEFLEKRFSPLLRQIFAAVTIISNVVAFLAAVLYGGALAIQRLFHSELSRLAEFLVGSSRVAAGDVQTDQLELWIAIVVLAVVAGGWAVYGGLSSVAWSDLFMVLFMIAGGIVVTLLGLDLLAGGGSLWDGFQVMIERNQAGFGRWQEAVAANVHNLGAGDHYNRLSVFQPASHPTHPWPSLIFGIFSISIWYNVLNQFMIQRVLGARDSYHARMGIVFAGFMKIFMPVIVVMPGLILFALQPEILLKPWPEVQPAADQGYIHLVQTLVPAGLRGLFLAALFGAIQSTVNSVLNSTATVITLDIYKRLLAPEASDRRLVVVGVLSSTVVLVVAIVLGGFIGRLGGGLFVYIQSLYAFFAPPFAAVFLLGILWKRINAAGATATVILGFLLGIAMKVFVQFCEHSAWIAPFANQAAVNWAFCMASCIGISLVTAPPRPEQVTDEVTVNWRKLNLFDNLGEHWYTSVVTWWGLFVAAIVALVVTFSGLVFPGV